MYNLTVSDRVGRIVQDIVIPPDYYGEVELHELHLEDLAYCSPIKTALLQAQTGWVVALWMDYNIVRAFGVRKDDIVDLPPSWVAEIGLSLGLELGWEERIENGSL